MTPTTRETSWVTDEETDESSDVGDEQDDEQQAKTRERIAWQERLRRGVRYMTHLGPRGNVMPAVGTHCIIMVGDARRDLGQMARINDRKSKMVEVIYRGAKNRRMEHKMKRPSSLVMLEDGLTMRQDAQGTVWVVRET
jgi:hypothetical protein